MSKTFKSVTDNESELDVRANDCGVFIAFSRAGQIRQASTFAPSDAPALALAILEAAGVESAYRSVYNAGSDWQLEHAVNELSEYVRARSEYEAEAEAQANLEAEALELRNTYFDLLSNPITDWDALSEGGKKIWLAVARKAREMRAEK